MMARKIAILIRDRQAEAFRVSSGLIMMDDQIDVFVLDKKVSGENAVQQNFELCKDMGLNIYTNVKGNADIEYMPTEEMAKKLLEYDFIDPY
ncbi:MAG: hypothetical protein QMD01_07170 [Thermodesulfovibrionales bacterium]|nr:hypothetical protein [Thermodesulfovibrionales bacterium]